MTYRGSAKGSGIKLTEEEYREAWALCRFDAWFEANLKGPWAGDGPHWEWYLEMQERWGDEQDS